MQPQKHVCSECLFFFLSVVSEIKLANSLSKTLAMQNADRLVLGELGSKHSIRSSRSKRLSKHSIAQQRRPEVDSVPSRRDAKKDESYVIDVERNENVAEPAGLDDVIANLPRDSLRSLPILGDAIAKKLTSCSVISRESVNQGAKRQGSISQQHVHPSASNRTGLTDGSITRSKQVRVPSQAERSLHSVTSHRHSESGEYRQPSLLRQNVPSICKHDVGIQSKLSSEALLDSEVRLQVPSEPELKSVSQMTTKTDPNLCSVCETGQQDQTPLQESQRGSDLSVVSSRRKMPAQTQTTPTLLSPIERPLSPEPPQTPPAPQEPRPSSHSGFVLVDKCQNFPSFSSDISPVYGVSQSRFPNSNNRRFTFEDYSTDRLKDLQENNSHTSSHRLTRDGVKYSQQRSGTRPPTKTSASTLRQQEQDQRTYSDRDEQIKESYIIRPHTSAHYLQDRLQGNQSRPSFHSVKDMYVMEEREHSLPKQQYSFYQEYVPTKFASGGDDKEWPVENYHTIGSRMDARRSYSQPTVYRKSEDTLAASDTHYNNNYPSKYYDYQNNREHIVMPIYKVPNTPPLPNPYQTTYREHFGVASNRTHMRPDRQLGDSGIEVNGSRETNYSGERYRNVPSRSPHFQYQVPSRSPYAQYHVPNRSPHSQYHVPSSSPHFQLYQQALANQKASAYGSDRHRREQKEDDFESRSSSWDGRHSRGPSTGNEKSLENDPEVLNFLKERKSVSGFKEVARSSPTEARRSRFYKYVQGRRSAPSGSVVPSDSEEQYLGDPQDDNNVLEYMRQKKTVSGLKEESRQKMPLQFVRELENSGQSSVPVRGRDRENDDEVLYYLRQKRAISGSRSDGKEEARERVMHHVKEDFEDVGPQSLETMADINQELKYTKMFAKNTTVYPPAATKIGERKDIKIPITARAVFSPPPSNRASPKQVRDAQDEGHCTPYQEYLRRSMIRWPVKDIDIRRSRDALKGNRLQELLNKDQEHIGQQKGSGNNNNIDSGAYFIVPGEEYPNDSHYMNQREQIEYNKRSSAGRNRTMDSSDENEFLHQVRNRGNEEAMAYQSRTPQRVRRPRTCTGESRDLTVNETQDSPYFGGSDSGLHERGSGPKHSTPKTSPIHPDLQRAWERRKNQQQSGSLLEVMRDSPTIQNKFFSKSENTVTDREERGVHDDISNTDTESRVGRRRSREHVLQTQLRNNLDLPGHPMSRPSDGGFPNPHTLSSLQGLSSERFNSRVSEVLQAPQSLLGDRHQRQRSSFIGYHRSRDRTGPNRVHNGQKYNSDTEKTNDSFDSISRTPPPPPNY